jgi:DNA-directed RNA polymerase specialized sigma24 family protein
MDSLARRFLLRKGKEEDMRTDPDLHPVTQLALKVSNGEISVREFLAFDAVQSLIYSVGAAISRSFPNSEHYGEPQAVGNEIIIRLLGSFTFRGESEFKSYVWRMAENFCKDDCRHASVRERIDPEYGAEKICGDIPLELGYSLKIEIDRYYSRWPDDVGIIEDWIRKMAKREPLSLEEIGRRHGFCVKTVRKRIHRFQRELRSRLEPLRINEQNEMCDNIATRAAAS